MSDRDAHSSKRSAIRAVCIEHHAERNEFDVRYSFEFGATP